VDTEHFQLKREHKIKDMKSFQGNNSYKVLFWDTIEQALLKMALALELGLKLALVLEVEVEVGLQLELLVLQLYKRISNFTSLLEGEEVLKLTWN